jgi:pimeloyl-ACP methyl ester carboxylesterase
MKRLPMWKGLTAMAPTLAYDTVDLMQRYPGIDTRDIDTRTLVMYGGASPAFMRDTAKDLSQKMPNAKLLALEGQTHDVKSDVMAKVLIEFFE